MRHKLFVVVTFLVTSVLLGACGEETAAPATALLNTPESLPQPTPMSSCLPIHYGDPTELLRIPSEGNPFDLRAGDFNGDGLQDIVIVRGKFRTPEVFELDILLNDGAGGFRRGTSEIIDGPVPITMHPRHTVLADFNGDGVMDVFIADHGEDDNLIGYQNSLLLSAPDGRMVNATGNLPQQSDFTHSAATADIDGDGDLDLYLGNLVLTLPPPQILANDGNGVFTVTSGRLPAEQAGINRNDYTWSAFVDVNNDGSPDLVLGGNHTTPNSEVLINDGAGYFSVLPNALPPKAVDPTWEVVWVQPADIDGDEYQDLMLLSTDDQYAGRYIQLLINNGDGTFRDETETRLPQSDNIYSWLMDIALHDLDNDGDLDITTRLNQIDARFDIDPYFLNDGNGVYTEPDEYQIFRGPSAWFYTFVDIDGDGGLDAVSVGVDDVFFLIRDEGC